MKNKARININKKIILVGINSKYIHPAMGIFSIYTNSKYELEYIEYNIKDDVKEITNYLENYDVILLSTYIWNIEIVKEILGTLSPKIIVLGGPEASFNPSLILEYPNHTMYVIKGEGEEAANEFFEYLEDKRSYSTVSNLYYLYDGEIYYTYTKLPDLANIKHDLSLIKDFENRVCYLEASRGCFYNCTYCLAATEKPVRYFDVEEIKENIRFLLDKKAKVIKFLDRSFNVKPEVANDLLLFILHNDNGVSTFQFEVNGDAINANTINILNHMRKKSVRLEIGIQSTNPQTIKAINRTQDFNKLKNNILALRDNCVIHTDLIAGLPFETFERFKVSFNDTFLLFTEELQLGTLKELKGTIISKTKDIYHYKFSETAPFEVMENDYISQDEINIIKKVEQATDKFYNYGYFNRTIKYLFNNKNNKPFDVLLDIITKMEKIKPINEFQFDELAKEFYNVIKDYVKNKDELLFLLKQDYLLKNKIKPKIWWERNIKREERLEIYNLFAQNFDLNIEELFRYGHLEKLGKNYFLVNYKTHEYYHYKKEK